MNYKPLSITAAIQSAFKCYQQGKLQDAENICSQILKLDPNNIYALHLNGVITNQTGNFENGVKFIRQAIALQNDYVEAYYSLGNIYSERNYLDEAISCYQKALTYAPNSPEIHFNLGNAQKNKEQLDEATAHYRKAISLKPDYTKAYINLGVIYQVKGLKDEAIEFFRKALLCNQNSVEALNNLGDVLREKGLIEEAGQCFNQALSLNPNNATVYNNLGKVMVEQMHLDKAAAFFRKAVELSPEYYEAYNNLGNLYTQVGLLSKAESIYNKAISIKPDYGMAHSNLGRVLFSQGRLDAAVKSYRNALNLKRGDFTAHSNFLFALNYFSDISQEEIHRESLQWHAQHGAEPALGAPVHNINKDKKRRLRVGYVSPDFRTHSVAAFIEPILVAHDKENIEIFCYADVRKPDEITARMQAATDHWLSLVGKSDAEVVSQIKSDSIDILVDLAGHTKDNRLPVFARKPAPIQITWLGYPNTTGLRAMDYRLTDAVADPVGEADRLHSEKLIRLEYGFLCYQADGAAPPVSELPCLQRGEITFGSLNNLIKTTPEVIKLWSRILHGVPNSRLVLKSALLTGQEAKKQYLALFAKEGINAKRLELFDKLPEKRDHLEFYNRIDIGLDPFPYNGTTTTCEALWMGVPVIALLGDRHAGRVGASILHRVGLDELVADSADAYVQLAQVLANDRDRLKQMRSGLREQMLSSELMDSRLFVRTLESVYRQMWAEWCDSVAE